MVLEKVKRERIREAETYAKLGVECNTTVYQAPISELAATNPELFDILRSTFNRRTG